MSSRRALAVSSLLSAAAHALPLLLLWIILPRVPSLEPPIPIELRPPTRPAPPPIAPPAPPPTRQPKRRPRAPAGSGAQPRTRTPVPAPRPTPPLPPPTSDLRPLGPAGARIVLVLRSDRIRESPYRELVQTLLARLPDHTTLLHRTSLDPLSDFDALLIATADPYDVTATFLAARHGDSARLHDALTKRVMPPGDPRRVHLIHPTLSVLARAEQVTELERTESGDGGAEPLPNQWLRALEHFGEAADTPALLLTVSDLDVLLRFRSELPTPTSVELAVAVEGDLRIHVRMVFRDTEEASLFELAGSEIVQRIKNSLSFLGLGSVPDRLAIHREGATLDLEGPIASAQAKAALLWITALLPVPPAVPAAIGDGGID